MEREFYFIEATYDDPSGEYTILGKSITFGTLVLKTKDIGLVADALEGNLSIKLERVLPNRTV